MKISFAAILVSLSFFGFSQNDYLIFPDDSALYNVDIINRGLLRNCQNLRLRRGESNYAVYGPNAVKFYFLEPNEFYESVNIQTQDSAFTAFARRMLDSKGQLYEYKNRGGNFFLLRDSVAGGFLFLSEENYRDRLTKHYQAGSEMAGFIAKMRFRKNHFTKFLERVENGDFSTFELNSYLTLEAGLAHTKFVAPQFGFLGGQPVPASKAFGFGFGAVFPLGGAGGGLVTGLFFNQYRIESELPPDRDFQYRLEGTQLQIPLMLRYTLQSGKVRPYFSGGPRGSFLVAEKHRSFVQVAQDSALALDLTEAGLFGTHYLHLGMALGVELELAPAKIWYFEARYFYPVYRDENEFIRHDFQVVMGIGL